MARYTRRLMPADFLLAHYKITSADEDFPWDLRQIADAPQLLYACGDRSVLTSSVKIAVIGPRKPSAYGLRLARQVTRDLVSAGICVVSGMAAGIDGLAHEEALLNKGKTIAVFGTGIDQIYPAENTALCQRIVNRGLVLSEYGPGHVVKPWNFAARNRIISGLSRAVVIVEAAEKSGTLVTAQCALDQDREVFAFPGPVDAPLSKGTHGLLRAGARLVCSAEDILTDLGLTSHNTLRFANMGKEPYNKESPDGTLLSYIGHDPIHVDLLREELGGSDGELSSQLLELEISGVIKKLPGQYYVRT
jgi:DNA processing protein